MNRYSVVFCLAVALTLLASGCFRYVPSSLETAPPGEDVRLLVTGRGASELARVIDLASEVPTVRGTVMEQDRESLLLRVPVGQRRDGFHTASLDQTIRVPVGEILQVERRELDVAKTGLVVAGAIAGSAFVIFSIMEAFGESSSGNGGGPEESRIPIRVISVPFGP